MANAANNNFAAQSVKLDQDVVLAAAHACGLNYGTCDYGRSALVMPFHASSLTPAGRRDLRTVLQNASPEAAQLFDDIIENDFLMQLSDRHFMATKPSAYWQSHLAQYPTRQRKLAA